MKNFKVHYRQKDNSYVLVHRNINIYINKSKDFMC